MGEGEIIVRDGEADLSGLNRDVEIAQYETKKETGLQGSFRVDDTMINMGKTFAWAEANPAEAWEKIMRMGKESWEGLGKSWDNTVNLTEKTLNFFSGDGFMTDDELKKNAETNISTDIAEIVANGIDAEQIKEKLKSTMNGEQIETNGDELNNGGVRFDQYALDPGGDAACKFISACVDIIIASGSNVEITLELLEKLYKEASKNGINAVGKDGSPMWINDYDKLAQVVSQYVGGAGVSMPNSPTWINENNYTNVMQNMVNILEQGGTIQAGFSGHAVSFNGYKVIDEKIIFTVIDSGKYNNTYFDPEKKLMFSFTEPNNYQSERRYDPAKNRKRYIESIRAVEKK